MRKIELSMCVITAKEFLPSNCWIQAQGMREDAIMQPVLYRYILRTEAGLGMLRDLFLRDSQEEI